MAQQTCFKFKKEYAIGPCILVIGILGIIFGLITSPERFPTLFLFLAGAGSIFSVVIPQNY